MKLKPRQKIFCAEYVIDWNGTRAYKVAYPNASNATAQVESCKFLSLPKYKHIQDYINEIQKDIEKLAGISKLSQINELKKIAYQNPIDVQVDWIKKKDFDKLSPKIKSCIRAVETEIRTINGKQIPFIKLEFFDKQRAITEINKMMGYYEAERKDITSAGKQITGITMIVPEEKINKN